jgi:hypothetical protein
VTGFHPGQPASSADGSRIRRSDRVAFGTALRGLPSLDVVCSRNAWSAISGIDDASVNTAMLATAEPGDVTGTRR